MMISQNYFSEDWWQMDPKMALRIEEYLAENETWHEVGNNLDNMCSNRCGWTRKTRVSETNGGDKCKQMFKKGFKRSPHIHGNRTPEHTTKPCLKTHCKKTANLQKTIPKPIAEMHNFRGGASWAPVGGPIHFFTLQSNAPLALSKCSRRCKIHAKNDTKATQ